MPQTADRFAEDALERGRIAPVKTGRQIRFGPAEPRHDGPFVLANQNDAARKPGEDDRGNCQPHDDGPIVQNTKHPARWRKDDGEPLGKDRQIAGKPAGDRFAPALEPQQPRRVEHHRQRSELVEDGATTGLKRPTPHNSIPIAFAAKAKT